MSSVVNNSLQIGGVEAKLSELERRIRELEKPSAGPTTDYKQLGKQYIGTQITEGIISLGGDVLGPTAIIRLFDQGGHIIGWLGSDVDVNLMLHTGVWIRDVLVSGIDELTGAAVGGWTSFVPTIESTASNVYTDLATLDVITINLSIATKLMIRYEAQLANAGGAAVDASSIVNTQNPLTQITGADVAGTDAVTTVPALGKAPQVLQYVASFPLIQTPVTQYVIKIRHKVSAGTISWSNRLLSITPCS